LREALSLIKVLLSRENLLLEISSTSSGKTAMNQQRCKKLTQSRFGNSQLPAIAAVFGFKEKKIIIQALEDTP
jgi:hypothetical protein